MHLDWPFFDDEHRALAADLGAWADAHVPDGEPHDADAASRTFVRSLGDAGWLRLAVALTEADRLDVRSLCLARETLAQRSALADFAFAMQGLGGGPVSIAGTAAQREAWLPAIARGEAVAAFALSEAEAGSDVAALATIVRREGDAWILDGEKTWISNAPIADVAVVFARTGPGEGHRGLGAFVVPMDTPGVERAASIETLSPHPLGTLRFTGTRLPADALIGQPGEGFALAMRTLDVFRSTVGAAALGMARRALAEAIAHVRQRELFGGTLADLQLVQGALADMGTDVDAAALLVYRAAWQKDNRAERVTREAAMAKAFATEAAQRVIDRAVQLFGGHGVTSGHIVERLYRDIRPLRIYEGATDIQRVVIARQMLKDDGRRAADDGGRTADG